MLLSKLSELVGAVYKGNDIEISLSPEETIERVKTAVTDPARRYLADPGHPEICNIYKLDEFFNPLQREQLADQCRRAEIGCVEHKKILAQQINITLQPFRDRRAELAANPKYVNDVLADGAQRARVIAQETLKEVKQKMGLA